ncbi:MAG: hydrogenase iron-sulfur subunit [Planctomycetota bacterium]
MVSAGKSVKELRKKVLVIGGGISGVTAAKCLSQAGAGVHLVERSRSIGGHIARMGCKATDKCLRCNVCLADEILRDVAQLDNVAVYTNTQVQSLAKGRKQRFRASLSNGNGVVQVEVDSVIVATGHEPYDPREDRAFGYGLCANVITGAEAEEQLAKKCSITRPSDGQLPKRVAMIQCVGSRTDNGNCRPEDTNYCSAVCCAYGLRLAQKINASVEDAEVTIFYMDIQNFGKGFNEFFRQSREQMRFIRCRPYEITAGQDGAIRVKYTLPGENSKSGTALCREEFDLIILAVGIRPSADSRELADKLLLAVDDNGFMGLKGPAATADTQREGIYVIGTAEAPKDIADCIAQAEAVSAMVMGQISGKKKKKTKNNQDVVVIGAGVASLQTAGAVAQLGHKVTILCSDKKPGGIAGRMPQLYAYLAGSAEKAEKKAKENVAELLRNIKEHKNISIICQARLAGIEGQAGDFKVTIEDNNVRKEITAGSIVIATGQGGAFPFAAKGMKNPAIFTDVAGLIGSIESGKPASRIAIVIDYLGEQNRSVTAAVLSASEMLIKRFGCSVKLYCNNIRVAAAGLEELYRKVRNAGLVTNKAQGKVKLYQHGSKVIVEGIDEIAGVVMAEEFDLAVMADCTAGCGIDKDTVRGLRNSAEGAAQYDNIWLLPVKTNRPGIFTVGAARGNSEFTSALADGLAAAGRIHKFLTDTQDQAAEDAASVDAEKCVLCLTCLRICPHGAIDIDAENKCARVSTIACQRCGICASHCPAVAIQLPQYSDEKTSEQLGRLQKVTIFACENSAYPAAVAAESAGIKYNSNVTLIKVPCAGKIDPRHVLQALQDGAQKVGLIGCHPESCRYLSGSSRAEKRIERIRKTLDKCGFEPDRVFFGGIASVEPARFAEYLKE